MKDSVISDEDYINVKKFYNLLKIKVYNFQDIKILCKIFEQRPSLLKEILKYNPRKCNSASSFSRCVHRHKSKCCIALPTDADFIRIFEKTLIGGFSCLNIRLAFYTDIPVDDPDKEKVIIELNIGGKNN